MGGLSRHRFLAEPMLLFTIPRHFNVLLEREGLKLDTAENKILETKIIGQKKQS